MEQTIIDRLHDEFRALSTFLIAHSEPSLVVTADDCFRKVLLLSTASLFETAVIEAIKQFVFDASAGNQRVVEFVRRKGLERQYHTMFAWDQRSAGPFFALFGSEFKSAMNARVKSDDSFGKAVDAFLEVGYERNRITHQNLAQATLEKTADEIFQLYRAASVFVDQLPDLLRTGGV
jgi:hypothetical protein